MNFDPGFSIQPTVDPLGFSYGQGVFGPEPELRSLDSIRKSLKDPSCPGPEVVYAISMDVGKNEHRQRLEEQMLLYGVVTYAGGRLGREPVRSQGHVHRVSQHSGWSPPEIYEIWSGQAIIYLQEAAEDHPGRCFAVEAGPGQVVVVPPGWAHMTISADSRVPLTFGAWCDREYGFEYDAVRARGGLAWFPVYESEEATSRLTFEANNRYHKTELRRKGPSDYSSLGIRPGVPLYQQYEQFPSLFQFVSQPGLVAPVWKNFIP